MNSTDANTNERKGKDNINLDRKISVRTVRVEPLCKSNFGRKRMIFSASKISSNHSNQRRRKHKGNARFHMISRTFFGYHGTTWRASIVQLLN